MDPYANFTARRTKRFVRNEPAVYVLLVGFEETS